jgi:hypothetical protein
VPPFIRLLQEVAGAPQGGGGQIASSQRRTAKGGRCVRQASAEGAHARDSAQGVR